MATRNTCTFFCVQVDFKNKAQPTQADCTLEFVSIEQAQNVLPLPYQQKALQVFLQTRNTYSIKTHATEQDLHQMLKLDDEYYANSYKGQFDLCKQWLEKNNQIYTMLLFENQIVGYINFMPLTKSAYILFKNGLITDEQIQPKHITGFDKTHCGLFASVVVDKNHRKAFKMLFNAFFEKLKQNNTKKFVCTAVSAQGKAILKFVQHKQVGTDAQNNAVYEVYLN